MFEWKNQSVSWRVHFNSTKKVMNVDSYNNVVKSELMGLSPLVNGRLRVALTECKKIASVVRTLGLTQREGQGMASEWTNNSLNEIVIRLWTRNTPTLHSHQSFKQSISFFGHSLFSRIIFCNYIIPFMDLNKWLFTFSQERYFTFFIFVIWV